MDIISRCRETLLADENIVFAYIFGSYVQGKLRADSDIDLAIYLNKKLKFDAYLELKISLTEACKREIDLVILNEAPPLLRYQIYKNNILLFARDKAVESNYQVKTLFEYSDVKRYLDLSYAKTIERLKNEVKANGVYGKIEM